MGELLYAAWRWVWYGLCIAMGLMAQERMGDMTTVASGAHAHPEVDAMQDMMAQMVEAQTNMMEAITTLAEGQVRLQEGIEALRESTAELQAATGELARALAIVQADVALLVARDS